MGAVQGGHWSSERMDTRLHKWLLRAYLPSPQKERALGACRTQHSFQPVLQKNELIPLAINT